MSECPSRFTVAQWKIDDLPALEQVAVGEHIASCPACRAIAEEIDGNMAAYRESADTSRERLARSLRRERAGAAGDGVNLGLLFRNRIAPAIGIAAAVATIAILVADPFDQRGEADEEETTFKGAWSFDAVAMRKGERFEVENGAVLEEGDAVRFAVTLEGTAYIALFGVGPEGTVTPYYPESPPKSDPAPMRLDGAGRHELPGSVVLDDATGAERFFVFRSDEEFDRREVEKELRASLHKSSPPSMEGLDVEELAIEKR